MALGLWKQLAPGGAWLSLAVFLLLFHPLIVSGESAQDHLTNCTEASTCRGDSKCIKDRQNLDVCLCENGTFWYHVTGNCLPIQLLGVEVVSHRATSNMVTFTTKSSTFETNVRYEIRLGNQKLPFDGKSAQVKYLAPGTMYTFLLVSVLNETTSYPKREVVVERKVPTTILHSGRCTGTIPCDRALTCIRYQSNIPRACLCRSGQVYLDEYRSCVHVSFFGTRMTSTVVTTTTIGLRFLVVANFPGTTSVVTSVKGSQPLNRGTSSKVFDGLQPGTLYTFSARTVFTAPLYSKAVATTLLSVSTHMEHRQVCEGKYGFMCDPRFTCITRAANTSRMCLCAANKFWNAKDSQCSPSSNLLVQITSVDDSNGTLSIEWSSPAYNRFNLTGNVSLTLNRTKQQDNISNPVTVDGLTPGEKYEFAIIAIYHIDEDYGDLTMKTIRLGIMKPAQPGPLIMLKSTFDTNRTILRFGPSEGVVDYYTFNVTSLDDGAQEEYRTNTTVAEFIKLRFGTRYNYTIVAYNAVDEPSIPQTGVFQTKTTQSSKVTDLTTEKVGPTNVTVKWTLPTTPNGQINAFFVIINETSDPTCSVGYSLLCSDCPSSTVESPPHCNSTENPLNFTATDVQYNSTKVFEVEATNLAPGADYVVAVFPNNAAGRGEVSSEQFRTPEKRAENITAIKVTPGRDKDAVQVYLDVALTPGERTGKTHFEITLTEKVNNTALPKVLLTGYSNTNHRFEDLLPNHPYVVDAVAVTQAGRSPSPARSDVVKTLPNRPGGIKHIEIHPHDTFAKTFALTMRCPPTDERNGTIDHVFVKRTSSPSSDVTYYSFPMPGGCRISIPSEKLEPIEFFKQYIFSARLEVDGLRSPESTSVGYLARPKPPILKPNDKLIEQLPGTAPSETSMSLTICYSCLTDDRQGPIIFVGLIVCVKPGQNQCKETDMTREINITYSSLQNYSSWALAKEAQFTRPYRATPDDWLLQSTANSFMLGDNLSCSEGDLSEFCNGPLPAERDVAVTAFACTEGGCSLSDHFTFRVKKDSGKDHTAACNTNNVAECRSDLQCLVDNSGNTSCLCEPGTFWYIRTAHCLPMELLKVKILSIGIRSAVVTFKTTFDRHDQNVRFQKFVNARGISFNGKEALFMNLNSGTTYNFSIVSILDSDQFYPKREVAVTREITTKLQHTEPCDANLTIPCDKWLTCFSQMGNPNLCLCPNTSFWSSNNKACVSRLATKITSLQVTKTSNSVTFKAFVIGLGSRQRREIRWGTGNVVVFRTNRAVITGLSPATTYIFKPVTVLTSDKYYPEREVIGIPKTVTTYRIHKDECSLSNECEPNLKCVRYPSRISRCLCELGKVWIEQRKSCVPVESFDVSVVGTNKTTNSVTFEWSANTYSKNVTYEIQKNNETGIMMNESSPVTVGGLTAGELYNFTITAILPADDYYPTKEAPVITSLETMPAQPGPVNVNASQLFSNPMTLVFEASEGKVAEYAITVTSPVNGSVQRLNTSSNKAQLTLRNGLEYTTVIYAYNTIKDESEPWNETFRTDPSTSSPVVNLTIGSILPESAVVSWKVPDYPNGDITAFVVKVLHGDTKDCLQSFTLTCSDCSIQPAMPSVNCSDNNTSASNFTKDDVKINSDTVFSQAVSPLARYKVYTINVYAYNDVGNGEGSNQTFRTAEAGAENVTSIKVMSVRDDNALQVYLKVRLVPGYHTGITNYTVTLTDTQSNATVASRNLVGYVNTNVTFPDLLASRMYKVSAFAETQLGRSPDVVQSLMIKTLPNKPGKPKNVRIQLDDTHASKFNLTVECPPENERNGTIEKVFVSKMSMDDSVKYFGFQIPPECSLTIPSDQLGQFEVLKNYSFAVTFQNEDFESDQSDVMYFNFTSKPPIHIPEANAIVSSAKPVTSENSIKLTVCASCLKDDRQGPVVITGLIVCVKSKQNLCDEDSVMKQAKTDVGNFTGYANWAQAEAADFTIPYRTTPDDWLMSNSSDIYTVGADSNCPTGSNVKSHCNGRMPSGREVIVTAVSCTSGGCVQSERIVSKTEDSDDGLSDWQIAIIVVAVVIVVVLVAVVVAVCIRRKRKGRSLKE